MASIPRRPHAVVVPFPSQGHVNPLMHFAKLLAGRGFFITFINTKWMEQTIFKPPNHSAAVSRQLQDKGLQIRFLAVPDGLPDDHGRAQAIAEYLHATQKLGPAMVRILQNTAYEAPPITCIMLLDKGYIPINVTEARRPENQITCLPGKIPPLWPTDLTKTFRIQDTADPTFQVAMYESEFQNKADYVLINVFEELEGPEAAEGLSKGYPALPIGPLFLPEFLQSTESSVTVGTSLWQEDLDCLQWLHTKAPSSVLYVSFGSIVVMETKQLHELALGLEASQHCFLWVIRPDISEGKATVLPEGFVQRIGDRGRIVQWAPQLKVLSHPSVGGFLTHNGWNSTLESISLGVPTIGWPLWAEQFHNCRFCKEIWKIGMDFESRVENENAFVSKEEVEKVVRATMEGPEGMELRKNAARLKEVATKAVMPEGSSYRNLDRFTTEMTARANSKMG